MGKDSPSPPATPDYAGAAQAQGAANVDTARLQARMSNPNIFGPLGSQTVSYGQPVFDQNAYNKALSSYQQDPTGASRTAATNDIASLNAQIAANKNPQGQYDPAFDAALSEAQGRLGALGQGSVMPTREQFTTANADQPTVTQTLTPAAQATLESQQRVQRSLAGLGEQGIGTASNVLGTAFNPNLPPIQTSLDTSGIARMPVNAGTTGQEAILRRLQPAIDRMDAQTRQRLANQGLVAGGEAYENAMIDVNQQKNDLLSQAVLQGIGLDTQANAQSFNQALQGGQFANTASDQALGRGLQLRNQPLNEIIGLMGGSQIQMPQFQGYQGSNIAPAPVFAGAQAAGQSAMQNYGIQQSGANAQTAGLYGLLGAGAGAYGMMNRV
jgi:hypothetical protein